MERIQAVLKELSFLGPEVYAVGGCVRDHVLGHEPHDIDLATLLQPIEVIAIAEDEGYTVIPTGLKQGTVTILTDYGPIEVTTFRSDIETFGRDVKVKFAGTIQEDLSRRDFTINAMAMNAKGEIIDPHGGKTDLKNGLIRTVGVPGDRFAEDYLRIIRAFRFAAKFDFKLHRHTEEAINRMSWAVLNWVSVERVVDEFNKAFKSDNVRQFLIYMQYYDILHHLVPPFRGMVQYEQHPTYHPEGNVWNHTLKVVDNAPPEYRWHALFHDIGKPETAEWDERGYYSFHGHEKFGADRIPEFAKKLKFSNALAEEIEATTRYHMVPLNIWRDIQGRGWLNGHVVYKKIHERAKRRFQLAVGKHLKAVEAVVRADRMEREGPTDAYLDWLFDPLPEEIKPVLMGRHLIERGWEPSPKFSVALKTAFEYQIEEGIRDVEVLYAYADNAVNGVGVA